MKEQQFSPEELTRYSRQLTLPEFNIDGQRKLKQSSVLIVGAGGLGCPMLLYLTAAGVGHIGIVDFDVVDASNLHRQVLFTIDDVGKPKAQVAAQKLSKLNPHVNFTVHNEKLTSENALKTMTGYNLVADGTDNFPTRYLVNDACVLLNIPNVHGSIFRFEGQISVFNYPNNDGTFGPQYRDIFPTPPPPGLVPNCAEGGVLGVLPGIIGTLQASEIIKVLTGIGDPLTGKLFIMDVLTFETRTFKITKNPNLIPPKELLDYEDFCGLKDEKLKSVEQISVAALKELMESSQDFQLIDVREPYEFDISNIGGTLIPLNEIEKRSHEISSSKKVIVHCRSGARSAKAIGMLEQLGFRNLVNLEGGILAWADQIDPSLQKY